jgi:hypothetical protein
MTRRVPSDLLAAGLLVLLAVLFFVPVLVRPLSAVIGSVECDTLTMFYPYRAFANTELQSGRLPLWNPFLLSGHPFHAYGQGAVLYPVNLLFAPLPTALALNLFALLHFAAAGLFFHLWLRALGLRTLPSLLGALAYSYSSEPIARLVAGHFTMLSPLALAPAILWTWERWRAGGSAAWLGGAAVAYGSLALAGHPQSLLYLSLYLGTLLAFRLVIDLARGERRPALTRTGLFGVALAIGAMVGAAQLLPSADFASRSFRQDASYEFIATFSFPPENFLTLLAPHFFGQLLELHWGRLYLWESWIHIGIFPLALAALAVARVRSRTVSAHALAAGLFAVLALGGNTPLLRILYDHVPLFDLFRGTSKFIQFSLISLCVLAAHGAERLLFPPAEGAARRDRLWLIALLAVVAAAGFGLLVHLGRDVTAEGSAWQRLLAWRLTLGENYTWFSPENPPPAAETWAVAAGSLVRLTILAVAGLTAAVLWPLLRCHRLAAPVTLLALTLPDVWLLSFNQLETAPLEFTELPEEMVRAVERGDEPTRVLSDVLPPNLLSVHGLETPVGYVGNTTARTNHLLTALSGMPRTHLMAGVIPHRGIPDALLWANVGTLILAEGNEPPAGTAEATEQIAGLAIHRVRDPQPRAYFSRQREIYPDAETALTDLESGRVDIREIDLVEAAGGGPIADVGPPVEGDDLQFLERLPMRVTLRSVTAGPRLLVLADAHDPDWRCTLDETTPLEILPVNIAFRGVIVPAGEHRIEFRYSPPAFRWGVALTCTGLMASVALLIGPGVARRREAA